MSKEKQKKLNYHKIVNKKGWSFDNAVRYKPDCKNGLTNEQVEERVSNGYINYVENKNTKTYKNIFFSNIFTFFNLLCFTVAIALIIVGEWNNLFFMVVFIANLLIGIIQEVRAKRTIEKISLITSPSATVVRNGEHIEIKTIEMVLDDIAVFTLGKQICADCIVIDGEVEVNESLLTGESKSIKKVVGDKLLSGSYVVAGTCCARVEKVGNASYSATLASKAKKYKRADSQLLKSLRLIIKSIGFMIVPLGILIFANNNAVNTNITDTIVKTAGSIIGMIPAGMFLLTSLALAVGVIKLAARRTLVQDLYSIEALSRINVLCLDKTGTITDGTMKVKDVIEVDEKNNAYELLAGYLNNFKTRNQTSLALVDHFGLNDKIVGEKVVEFSSDRKYSAVTTKDGTYALGAPEILIKSFDKNVKEKILSYVDNGYRVIAFTYSKAIKGSKLPSARQLIAFIVIEDYIRKDAKKTIKWFVDNDVEIKIISGDNAHTVSKISKRVGILNYDKFISLEGLTDQQVAECANKYTIFGRVSPEQKCILIKALKADGKKVGMTGDGVNDILALKEADCSIAMASGSEATRNVSNLVLLDSNFSSMPNVVAEGRRVVNNISKSSSLFLMKTVFTISLTLICLIFNMSYPFIPNQILLLETFAIGVPAFFLALEPSKERIKGNFMKNILLRALPGGLIYLINFVACVLYVEYTISGGAIVNAILYETMSSLCITFTGLLILFKVCLPFNWLKVIMYFMCCLGSALTLGLMPLSFYNYIPLDHSSILFIIIVVLASLPLVALIIPTGKWKKKEKVMSEQVAKIDTKA